MLNFCEKHKGAISVFLTLILIPTFIFGGVIIDGSRILGSKNLVSGAGDLAMNGALANYYDELNQIYGLLAMADTAEEMQDVLQDFFEVSLNASGVSKEDFSKALVYLELTNDGFRAADVVDTQIYQTEVLKQEVLEYMKFRAPVTMLNSLIVDRFGDIKGVKAEKEAAEGQLEFESSLDDLQDLFDEIKKHTDALQEIYPKIKDKREFDILLKETEQSYKDDITLLATAKKRLDSCSDVRDGDKMGMMEEMVDLSGKIDFDASGCSCLIKMKIIENSVHDPGDILEGMDPQSEEYKERLELLENYYGACENLADGIDGVGKELDRLVKESHEKMKEQWELAKSGMEHSKELKKKLEKLQKEFAKLREKLDAWDGAVQRLPDGSQNKPGYTENVEDSKELFQAESSLDGFYQKVLNSEAFYTEAFERLDTITFGGGRIAQDIREKEHVLSYADGGAVIEAGELTQKAWELMESCYSPIGAVMELSVQKEEIEMSKELDKFIKQLEEYYCNTDSQDEEAAKRAEEAFKIGGSDDMAEKAGGTKEELEHLLLCTDLEDLNVNELGKDDIPSKWLAIAGEAGADESDEIAMSGGIDKDNRKKTKENGSENLNSNNEMLAGIGNGIGSSIGSMAMDVIETPYLSEYVMGMFSHNTSNWDAGEEVTEGPFSINNSELKDNEIYRAEIEYILWGSPNIRTNVKATKAVIFAINLAFNMGFAFTNPRMKADANKIAAFFPGTPAQIAIKCILQTLAATVETTRNMLDLMKGKRVALIKTDSVWETWLDLDGIVTSEEEKKEDAAGFTYEDYLRVLVYIKMLVGRKNMLARTADMIELNLTDSKAKEDNTLKDKYTMVEVEASVQIDTFFLQKLNGAGYNVRQVGKEDFTIPYYGVKGY